MCARSLGGVVAVLLLLLLGAQTTTGATITPGMQQHHQRRPAEARGAAAHGPPETAFPRPTWGEWIPAGVPAWRERLDYRAEQIKRIESDQERWDGLMNLAMVGLLVPNFTALGYEVIETPASAHAVLNATLHRALDEGRERSEGPVDQISGPKARFVDAGRAKQDVMRELQPVLEAWSGVKLVPSTAYGLRLYQPGNTLTMHTDRLESHVVSCIVHVDRDVDEPWPIAIEGLDGRTREVDLRPGQTLLCVHASSEEDELLTTLYRRRYESAKFVHGRPRPLNGRWYTSLFCHWRPTDWTTKTNDARALIEPFWPHYHEPRNRAPGSYAALRLRGTGYYEPECEHMWCNLSPVWPPPAGFAATTTTTTGADDSGASAEL